MSHKDGWPREKRWKDVYTRSQKLSRARHLGFGYPRVTASQQTRAGEASSSEPKLHVLFVCSRNQWRSPTAEAVWRKDPRLSVRSAGTSSGARRKVSSQDIRWADVVLVMEDKHRTRLLAEFARLLEHKPVHVLDVPDDYQYMDPELVALLERQVEAALRLG